METLTSWSTRDSDDGDDTDDVDEGIWSLIREGSFNAAVNAPSTSINWYVKGPSGLYGPFLEDEATARKCLQAKLDDVGDPAPLSADMRPVEPVGPFAEDNANFV